MAEGGGGRAGGVFGGSDGRGYESMAVSGRVVGGEGCGEFDTAVTTCMTICMIWSGYIRDRHEYMLVLVHIARYSKGVLRVKLLIPWRAFL